MDHARQSHRISMVRLPSLPRHSDGVRRLIDALKLGGYCWSDYERIILDAEQVIANLASRQVARAYPSPLASIQPLQTQFAGQPFPLPQSIPRQPWETPSPHVYGYDESLPIAQYAPHPSSAGFYAPHHSFEAPVAQYAFDPR